MNKILEYCIEVAIFTLHAPTCQSIDFFFLVFVSLFPVDSSVSGVNLRGHAALVA